MHNLLTFFAKYYHWFIFLLLEVASGVMLFRYNSYQGSVWISSANAVVGKVYEWQSDFEQYFSLIDQNKALTQRNLVLEQQLSACKELLADAQEDSVKSLQAMMAHVGNYRFVQAKVVSNSIDRPDNLITIDRGTEDGVEVDMGVACGTGIVGVVYQASTHYSIVIPVLNKWSRISCAIRGKSYFGYVTWDGVSPVVAYVDDIPRHAKFKVGDWVETSGYSSIFPKGILIGKIMEIFDSADGLSYRLKINLSTDFSRLRDVCVITEKDFAERIRLHEAALDSMALQKGRN
jgi:rod shape-determining protein MreC